MLLDRGRMSLANLETTYGRLPLIQRINDKYFNKETSQLTREVVEALLKARVARMEDGWLIGSG
jgi:hypothetical protein